MLHEKYNMEKAPKYVLRHYACFEVNICYATQKLMNTFLFIPIMQCRNNVMKYNTELYPQTDCNLCTQQPIYGSQHI